MENVYLIIHYSNAMPLLCIDRYIKHTTYCAMCVHKKQNLYWCHMKCALVRRPCSMSIEADTLNRKKLHVIFFFLPNLTT